jgi:dihydroorotate dehydrogenase
MIYNFLYKCFIKPFFFLYQPENAHEKMKNNLRLAFSIPKMSSILSKITTYHSDRLKQTINNIEFANPVGLGAGFDKTGELYPYLQYMGFGFIEIGTITGEEQPGNPKPRIFRYPKDEALINRMGFNNPGSLKTLSTIKDQKRIIPRGINAGKTKIVEQSMAPSDYYKTLSTLCPFFDYAVINISSPNTPGLRDLQTKDNFIQLVKGIQEAGLHNQSIPIYVKLAPDLNDSDILELLDCVLELKLSGVILTNTTIDKSVIKKYPLDQLETGGISGKPVKERSTAIIRLAYRKLQGRIPIIGVGGIDSGESALEKIRAGANLVQIYTGYVYQGPMLPYIINQYIDNYLRKNKISSIAEIIGEES